MDNCSKHPKEIAGISDMKELANRIGDLHYETLTQLLGYLSDKLKRDAAKDLIGGRRNISRALSDAGRHISMAWLHIRKAWKICEPFMSNTK